LASANLFSSANLASSFIFLSPAAANCLSFSSCANGLFLILLISASYSSFCLILFSFNFTLFSNANFFDLSTIAVFSAFALSFSNCVLAFLLSTFCFATSNCNSFLAPLFTFLASCLFFTFSAIFLLLSFPTIFPPINLIPLNIAFAPLPIPFPTATAPLPIPFPIDLKKSPTFFPLAL